jgi:uncharacterized membrane protein YecN with MAPEG domain
MATVTASFAAILVLLLTLLGINTTRHRFRGGKLTDPVLRETVRRASRAHGNTFEHAIPVLLLMFFYEVNGGVVSWLCTIGTVFVLARLSYAYGCITKPGSQPMQLGAGVTYLVELVLVGLVVAAVM